MFIFLQYFHLLLVNFFTKFKLTKSIQKYILKTVSRLGFYIVGYQGAKYVILAMRGRYLN